MRHPAIFFSEFMENRLSTRSILLLFIFVVLGVYYPAIFAPINSVDDPGMYYHLLNTDEYSFRDIFLPGVRGTYYRPILIVSFLVDKFVWGLEESFMHLENILFHLVNVLLVFAIAHRVSNRLQVESPIPAFVATLFFAIHPINTESVVWISGRTDLLAGIFIFLTTYLLLGQRHKYFFSLLAAFSFLLACLSKDTAVFFFPAAIIIPFFLSRDRVFVKGALLQTVRNNVFHFFIFTASCVSYFLLRALAFKKKDVGINQVISTVAGDQSDGLLLGLRLVFKAAGFYVKKLFVPFPLNFSINHVSDLYVIIGVMLIFVVILLLVRRTIPGFFLIAATAIGSSALLVPLLKMTWTPLAERYMYMPSAFFVIGTTFYIYPLVERMHFQRVMIPVVICLVTVAIYGTAQRAILWQDNLALYEDCRKKSPDFIPAQNEVANALYSRGKTQEAIKVINSIVPQKDFVNVQYLQISKASALFNSGDVLGAHDLLLKTLQHPGKLEVKIITQLLKLNDYRLMQKSVAWEQLYSENVQLLSRLYELTKDPFYLYRLGQAHMFEGERVKARDAFQRVVNQASRQAYYYSAAQRLQEKLSN